jgi:predicted NBD/HSP70 family sugar kinase
LLRVDTAHWNIISVDLSQPYLIQGAIITITGAILERTEMSMEQPTDITTCKVVELCRLLMAKAAGEILGFGIAVPGIVNGAGVVLKSTTLGWNKVHLKSIIEKEFNKPAVIDHDAHSALLAERYFGKGTPNTLFIQLTLGVGASLLIEDSTVLGVNHHAGEIGHVTVNGNGPQCICGKRGCLESLVSLSAIRSRLSQPGSDRLEVLTQSGQYLGQALAFPVNLLDIDDIVVYGPPDIVGPQFLHSVKRTLIGYGSTNSPHHYCVRRCECGSDIVMLGESISVLQLTLATL